MKNSWENVYRSIYEKLILPNADLLKNKNDIIEYKENISNTNKRDYYEQIKRKLENPINLNMIFNKILISDFENNTNNINIVILNVKLKYS